MPSAALRLAEPAHWTCPHGQRQRPKLVHTYGPVVADFLTSAGREPDPQQQLGLDLALAFDPATDVPVTFELCVICARQNLKSSLFQMLTIGWLYVLEVPAVMWTAHEAKTAGEAQASLTSLLEGSPALSRLLPTTKNRGSYDENGDERIELATGQRVAFRTRTKNGARGLSEVHKLILDEGLGLTPRQMGAMAPVIAAKPHGQVVVGSSAGPVESEVLREMRDRGRAGTSARMTYLEWCARREPCGTRDCSHPKDALLRGIDCALDREHLMREANPTLTTGRMTIETLRGLRQTLPPEEFSRECLTWWDDPAEHEVLIPAHWWDDQADTTSRIVGRPQLGLEVAEDRSWAAIGAAGLRKDGRVHLELTTRTQDGRQVVDYRPGTEWVPGRLAEIQQRIGKHPVAIASGSAAMALRPQLDKAGVAFEVVKHGDAIAACGRMYDAINTGQVRHLAQTPLTVAVQGTRKRNAGDGAWAFGRRQSTSDISPFFAVTLAAWLLSVVNPTDYDPLDSVF